MFLEIIIGFLLFDAIFAIVFWWLTADDFRNLDTQMAQAETARDRAIDEWLYGQGRSSPTN